MGNTLTIIGRPVEFELIDEEKGIYSAMEIIKDKIYYLSYQTMPYTCTINGVKKLYQFNNPEWNFNEDLRKIVGLSCWEFVQRGHWPYFEKQVNEVADLSYGTFEAVGKEYAVNFAIDRSCWRYIYDWKGKYDDDEDNYHFGASDDGEEGNSYIEPSPWFDPRQIPSLAHFHCWITSTIKKIEPK